MRFLWFTFVLLSLTTVHTLGQEQKQWRIHAKTGFFTDRVNYPIQIEMGGNLYFKKGFSIGTGLVAYHIGDESSEYPIGVQVSLYSPKYPINHNHFLIGLETGLKYHFGKSL
jgi:hypothetical protein